MDPGASDNVLPICACTGIPVTKVRKAKMGLAYAAVGGRADNEGQGNMTFFSQDGNFSIIDSQVAAVNAALGSVPELVDAGHRVIFGW